MFFSSAVLVLIYPGLVFAVQLQVWPCSIFETVHNTSMQSRILWGRLSVKLLSSKRILRGDNQQTILHRRIGYNEAGFRLSSKFVDWGQCRVIVVGSRMTSSKEQLQGNFQPKIEYYVKTLQRLRMRKNKFPVNEEDTCTFCATRGNTRRICGMFYTTAILERVCNKAEN